MKDPSIRFLSSVYRSSWWAAGSQSLGSCPRSDPPLEFLILDSSVTDPVVLLANEYGLKSTSAVEQS